jgi:hypothetical protein
VPVDAGHDEGNGAGHVADRRPQADTAPRTKALAGGFLLVAQLNAMGRSSIGRAPVSKTDVDGGSNPSGPAKRHPSGGIR